eukprot:Nk52_evm5s386 gene=Nk52_evmTU5s386
MGGDRDRETYRDLFVDCSIAIVCIQGARKKAIPNMSSMNNSKEKSTVLSPQYVDVECMICFDELNNEVCDDCCALAAGEEALLTPRMQNIVRSHNQQQQQQKCQYHLKLQEDEYSYSGSVDDKPVMQEGDKSSAGGGSANSSFLLSSYSYTRPEVTLICGHRFHLSCIGSEFNRVGGMVCPYCQCEENSVWGNAMEIAGRNVKQLRTEVDLGKLLGGLKCDEKEQKCLLCLGSAVNKEKAFCVLGCGHGFHLSCIGNIYNSYGRMKCSFCNNVDRQGSWLYMIDPSGRRVSDAQNAVSSVAESGLNPDSSSRRHTAPTEYTRLLDRTSRSAVAFDADGREINIESGGFTCCPCSYHWVRLYARGWARTWRHGVNGECRIIRLVVLAVLWASAFSMLLKCGGGTYATLAWNINTQSIANSAVWFTIPLILMVFVPASLLPIGLTTLACQMMYRYAFSLYTCSQWELLLEPIAIVLCIILILNYSVQQHNINAPLDCERLKRIYVFGDA